MEGEFFASVGSTAKEEHCGLVDERKSGEITGVGTCGFEDEGKLLAEADGGLVEVLLRRRACVRARAEEEDHAIGIISARHS